MARQGLLKGRMGVYCVRNLKDNKRYVGSSSNLGGRKKEHFFKLSHNISHHTPLQEAYKVFGKNAFIFEVLEYCEKDVLIEREQYWMDHYKSWDREFGYNTSVTAGNITHTEETKKNISNFHSGKKDSEHTKKLKSESLKGRVLSDETKKKIGDKNRGNRSRLGKKNSEESKQKQREKMTGRKHSEERNKKQSERLKGNSYAKGKNLGNTHFLGKKHSEETKKKISEKIRIINLGKKHSEEIKQGIRDSRLLRIDKNS